MHWCFVAGVAAPPTAGSLQRLADPRLQAVAGAVGPVLRGVAQAHLPVATPEEQELFQLMRNELFPAGGHLDYERFAQAWNERVLRLVSSGAPLCCLYAARAPCRVVRLFLCLPRQRL